MYVNSVLRTILTPTMLSQYMKTKGDPVPLENQQYGFLWATVPSGKVSKEVLPIVKNFK